MDYIVLMVSAMRAFICCSCSLLQKGFALESEQFVNKTEMRTLVDLWGCGDMGAGMSFVT